MIRYLIDGCNYIHSVLKLGATDFETVKMQLISRLSLYAKSKKKVKITVVFDSSRPYHSCKELQGIEVIHVNDADREIAEKAASSPAPRSLTAVSDDRRLISTVKETGAQAMSVREFNELLEKKLSTKTRSEGKEHEKPSAEGMSEQEVARWKKELGLD